jgi:hypothetical protein
MRVLGGLQLYYILIFKDVDMTLGRLLYIGVLFSFKSLLLEALTEVLEKRTPYFQFSAKDISQDIQNQQYELVKFEEIKTYLLLYFITCLFI